MSKRSSPNDRPGKSFYLRNDAGRDLVHVSLLGMLPQMNQRHWRAAIEHHPPLSKGDDWKWASVHLATTTTPPHPPQLIRVNVRGGRRLRELPRDDYLYTQPYMWMPNVVDPLYYPIHPDDYECGKYARKATCWVPRDALTIIEQTRD